MNSENNLTRAMSSFKDIAFEWFAMVSVWGIAAAALLFIGSADWRPSRITAYPALCSEPTINGECRAEIVSLIPWTRFRVDAEAQRVIKLERDGHVTSLGEICQVFDKRNWRCTMEVIDWPRDLEAKNPSRLHYTMKSGKLTEGFYAPLTSLNNSSRTVYLSYWAWWKRKASDWWRTL